MHNYFTDLLVTARRGNTGHTHTPATTLRGNRVTSYNRYDPAFKWRVSCLNSTVFTPTTHSYNFHSHLCSYTAG